MATWHSNLFYIVFLSQIFMISYYFPRKLLERMRYVFDQYPPSRYPKLYPRPVDYYRIGRHVFKIANQVIFWVGILILFAVVYWVDHSTFADDGYISEFWPAVYGIIQFLPLIMLELSEFSHNKMMRNANTNSTRKAELRRRRLTDIVPPTLLGLAAAAILVSIFYDFYVHDFVVEWGHDSMQRTIVLIITNMFLAAVGAWNLYGRKQDPHQSSNDRTRRMTINLRSFLYTSIAMSIYFMTAAADDVYDIDFLDATLLSAYFQVIIFLSVGHVMRSVKLCDVDFDVYRNDTATT